MTLLAGARLGPYEIQSALGAGGMGEVYRARDTKLDREVAIKILPELFVADAERVARFAREAHVLASLNHPHIAQIYGLEESNGISALVMELVEGPTLADRIAGAGRSEDRPLQQSRRSAGASAPAIPLDEVLTIAKQIAEALEAAHEHGIGALDSTERTRVIERSGSTDVRYSQGHLLFLRETTLMAQPFDPDRRVVTGEPVPVAEQIQTQGMLPPFGHFSVSATGVLAYQTGASGVNSQLLWFDRTGKPLGVLSEPGEYATVSLSLDGTRAAVSLRTGGNTDIWLVDVARGIRTRLTFDPADENGAVWSPDGAVAFNSRRGGQTNLYRKIANGSGSEELIDDSAGGKLPLSWSSDGRFLLYSTSPVVDLRVLPLFGDRKPKVFLQTPFNEGRGQFSPDGRWIAYRSDESGRFEVYVAPFPGPGGKWQVSTGGGNSPRWRRDGQEIFYVAPDGRIMSVTVNGRESAFEVGNVRPLFNPHMLDKSNGPPYDVSADGQRFLVNTQLPDTDAPPLTVVINWTAGLRN